MQNDPLAPPAGATTTVSLAPPAPTDWRQAARVAHAEGCRLRELAAAHQVEAERLHALADQAFRRAAAAAPEAGS
jgi:hypothetical protein